MTVYINVMYYVYHDSPWEGVAMAASIPKRVRHILTPRCSSIVLRLNHDAGDDLLEEEHQDEGEGTL
ncbi:hypothetical protein Fmac_032045 [Flemingia macrophylla]|uniref:Uncharacterized protein n=1 Tax=Flemingia macrophylla TaxID=520843 RepID=A0ABD1L3T4_9FABA